MALQKALNEEEQAIFLKGDPGYDISHNGSTIDVKTTATHLDLPDLLIPHDQDLGADIYYLVHQIGPRRVRLVGWALREYVAEIDPERYPGHAWNRVVRPDELHAP